MIAIVFDPTLNVGQVLTIAMVLFAGLGIFYGVRERVAVIEKQLAILETKVAAIEARQQQYLREYLPIISALRTRILDAG